jgi:hypothetical protein
MSWRDEQPDPLDDLLQKAAWPEPRAEQLDRLSRKWRGTVRRRKVRNAAVIAATIVPIAALVWSLSSWSRRQAPAGPQIIAIEKPGTLTPSLSQGEREKNESVQVVLEPTAYEQTLAVLYRHQAGLDRRGVSTEISATASTGPVMSTIDGFFAQVQPSATGIAKELTDAATKFEIPLRDWYRRSMAAANDDLIARNSSTEQLANRARSEYSRQRQRLWIGAILRRGTSVAVSAFLDLAGDPSTETAAFEAAQDADGRTIDKLFAALESNRVPTRQTAARVLGSLNNPNVSQRLAQMALESPGRREALIGLLSSSDPVARKFLAGAQHDAQLAPSIRALVRF